MIDSTFWEFIKSEAKQLVILGIITIVIVFFAWGKGFFTLKEEAKKTKVPITGKNVLALFFIFIGGNFFLSPIIAKIIQKVFSHHNLRLVEVLTWTNFCTTIFISLAFFYICKKILFSDNLVFFITKTKKIHNFFYGILTWFIAFPIVLFCNKTLEIATFLIYKVTKIPEQLPITYLKTTLSSPWLFSIAILSIVFFAPIIEELLFRGFLQNWLKTHLGRKAAILLTSLLFACFHFSYEQTYGNIPIIGSLFFLACFLGFIYEKQKSLLTPIALHMTFNLFSVLNIIFWE